LTNAYPCFDELLLLNTPQTALEVLFMALKNVSFAVSRLVEKSTSDNFAVAVSLHRGGIVTALNYTDREQECAFRVAPGKRLVPLSGSAKRLPKCSAAFYRLENQA